MESLEKCLHQVFRPKYNPSGFAPPGWGNCFTCKYEPKENKKCPGYSPITVNYFTVIDNKPKS